MSSMMAQRVATNNLAHSYMAFNTNYHDTGLFGVYAVSDPKSQPVDDLVSSQTDLHKHPVQTGIFSQAVMELHSPGKAGLNWCVWGSLDSLGACYRRGA